MLYDIKKYLNRSYAISQRKPKESMEIKCTEETKANHERFICIHVIFSKQASKNKRMQECKSGTIELRKLRLTFFINSS